jgi:hypothetical protein
VASRILARLRELVRQRRYVVSSHATEELEDDELNVFDLESIVFTGEIIERQRDHSTREQKFLVRGHTLSSAPACLVAKFDQAGRAVIITVYAE